jgi:hypothetical protein
VTAIGRRIGARAIVAFVAVVSGAGLLTACFPAPAPDLQVAVTDAPDPVAPGSRVTYTVTVTNGGGSATVEGTLVKFSTTLLTNFSFTAASGYSCIAIDIPIMECSRSSTADTLVAGATRVFTFSGVPFSGITTASVTAVVDEDNVVSESAEANNQDTETTTVTAADLHITLADAPDPVAPGGTVTWTVTVGNAVSALTIAPGVRLLRLTAPGSVSGLVTVAPSGYQCGVDGGEVVFVDCQRSAGAGGDPIPVGGERTFTVTATAPSVTTTLSAGAVVDPLAVVTEANESNNTAAVTTAVGTRTVGRVQLVPRHGQADVGRPERLRITWTHPDSWRLLDTLEVRLTLAGTKVFRARWDERSDVIRQLEGDAVVLDEDASGAAGQNQRKVRLTLVVEVGGALAGDELAVEALATDDAGRTQDWSPVGTLQVRT